MYNVPREGIVYVKGENSKISGFEPVQKRGCAQAFLLFSGQIMRDSAFRKVQQPVSIVQGVLQVVGHHQGRQTMFPDQLVGQPHDQTRRPGVQGRRGFVEQEYTRSVHYGHDQRQGLPLPARKRSHGLIQLAFQPQSDLFDRLLDFFPERLIGSDAETLGLCAQCREAKVLQ